MASRKSLERQFQRELIKNKDAVNSRVIKIFIDTQKAFLDDVQSNKGDMMPYVTGNLHDSIGSVISLNSRVVRAMYLPPEAVTTSAVTGKEIFSPTQGMGRAQIRGAVEAARFVRNANYPRGLAATLFIAVPYAEKPNEKGTHPGYADELEFQYQKAIGEGLYTYDKYNIFDRKKPII